MPKTNREEAPRYRRDGITSYLLASAGTTQSQNLTTTLVEMDVGGEQKPHSHLPEQTYFILEGSGVMTVDSEAAEVTAGDCIFIPSEASHGLQNTGSSVLRYYSAASPSFTREQLERLWPLPSIAEERRT